jgi:hypothetical protein
MKAGVNDQWGFFSSTRRLSSLCLCRLCNSDAAALCATLLVGTAIMEISCSSVLLEKSSSIWLSFNAEISLLIGYMSMFLTTYSLPCGVREYKAGSSTRAHDDCWPAVDRQIKLSFIRRSK